MRQTLLAIFLLAAFGSAVFAQTATATKTITITVSAANQTAADNKADNLEEDFVLAVAPELEKPLPLNAGTCAANPLDIYLREDANAASPLIPCAVKLTAGGKRRVAPNKLDNVFQRLIRQIVQRAVKDRRAIEAAEIARKDALNAADEVDIP
jgi:hypothetical protein